MNDIKPASILLCDDHQLNRKLIVAMLATLPFSIMEVSNGRDAISAVLSDHGSFDLILLDISMKEIGGIEVCTTIRNCEQDRTRPLPIIAYTASAMTDEREQYMSAGFNDVLTKPTTQNILLEMLKTYLPNHFIIKE